MSSETTRSTGVSVFQQPWPTHAIAGVPDSRCVATAAAPRSAATNTSKERSRFIGFLRSAIGALARHRRRARQQVGCDSHRAEECGNQYKQGEKSLHWFSFFQQPGPPLHAIAGVPDSKWLATAAAPTNAAANTRRERHRFIGVLFETAQRRLR